MYDEIARALRSDRFAYSDLGDGTAVLTSLADSRIISLNAIGNEIVSTLLKDAEASQSERLSGLAQEIATRHNIELSRAQDDIDNFVKGLSQQLGTSPD